MDNFDLKKYLAEGNLLKETLDDVVWDKIEAFRNAVNDDEYVISSLIKAMSTDDANLYLDAIMRDHNFEDGSLDHLDVVPVGDEEEARRKEKEYYTNRGNTSGTIDENVSSKFSEPLG